MDKFVEMAGSLQVSQVIVSVHVFMATGERIVNI